jgi:tripartite-type tricarboxylate transporter receptor subunit TctC
MLRFALFAATLCACVHAVAQSYPTRPVRLIISYPAGGGIDVTARALAQKMGEGLGQQVIVDNRVGGNTLISAEAAARAAPDGYTLFMPLDATMTQNPALYEKLPYDPVRDFVPVARVTRTNSLLVTFANAPFKSLGDLVAYAKAHPGKLNFSTGAVSTGLIGEVLKSSTGIDMVFVPYKGSAPMLTALMAGEVDLVIDGFSTYVSAMKQEKLRGLALATNERMPQMPEIPTAREAGFPQLENSGWLAVFAPAGTPQPIVARLNTEIARALARADLKAKLDSIGVTVAYSGPEQLAALLKSDTAKWGPVIRAAGIKVE